MEPGELADRRRERTGEIITVEEDTVQCGSVEELGRYGAVEVVVVKVESPEINQSTKFRRNVPPEIIPGDGDPNDPRVREPRDVIARNAGPTTRRGVVFIPVGENRRAVRLLING